MISSIILCGGKNTRLSSYKKKITKPLIKYKGKTLLEYHLINLEKLNLKKNFINTFKKKRKFNNFKKKKRLNFEIIDEKKLRGTAGVIISNLNNFTDEIMVLYGDNFINFDVKKFIIYNFVNGDHGVGSEYHMMIASFSMAYHTNRIFLLTGKWQFSGNMDYTYWFKKITNYDEKNISDIDSFSEQCYNGLEDSLNTSKFIKIGPGLSYTFIHDKYGHPPEKYKDKSIIWWKGKLLNYLMRPNNNLLKIIDNEKSRMGLKSNFIALQVRHSSSWIYNRKNIPLS